MLLSVAWILIAVVYLLLRALLETKPSTTLEPEQALMSEMQSSGKYLMQLREQYTKLMEDKYKTNINPEKLPRTYEGNYDPCLHVFDNFPLPFWIYDMGALNMYFANKAGLKMWNVSTLSELQRKDFTDISAATARQFAHWTSMWEIDESQTIETTWTFYPDGHPIPANVIAACYKFPSGRIGLYVIASPAKHKFHDKIQAQLLRSHESTRHSLDMISLYNMNGELVFQNPAAHKLGLHVSKDPSVGITVPKFDKNTFLPYVTSRDVVEQIIRSIIAQKSTTFQVKVRFNDVSAYHQLSQFIINDPITGEKCVLVTESDITTLVIQRKKLRQEELTKKELLKAKSRAEIFLGAMSHEIRTPLHGIIGLSQALLDPQHHLSGEPLRLATNISSVGEHLLHLINNTLDLSKLEANRLELKIAPYDPYRIVKQVIDWLEPLAQERHIYLTSLMPVDLPLLMGDVSRVEQILINLTSNAIKFTSKGGVSISVHVSAGKVYNTQPGPDEHCYHVTNNDISMTSIDEYDQIVHADQYLNPSKTDLELDRLFLYFVVKDSGIGIKRQDLCKLFQRFSQLELSYTRAYEGSGLGVSICKELSCLMGGAIGVRSTERVGSTFWVSVPFERCPECKELRYSLSLPNVSVLVIDEREFVLSTFSHYLKQWDIKFTLTRVARNELQLQGYLRTMDGEHQPDYLFISNNLEYSQPVIRQLKWIYPTTRIYVVVEKKDISNVYSDYGFEGIIALPIHISDLVAIVGRVRATGQDKDMISNSTNSGTEHTLSKKLNEFKILLVEDNLTNQMVAINFLKAGGFVNIQVEGNGLKGFQSYQEQPPDIVLMDILMPEMNGFQSAEKIRNCEQQNSLTRVPIIALTASPSPEIFEKIKEVGMDDLLSKPFKPAELKEKIITCLLRSAGRQTSSKPTPQIITPTTNPKPTTITLTNTTAPITQVTSNNYSGANGSQKERKVNGNGTKPVGTTS